MCLYRPLQSFAHVGYAPDDDPGCGGCRTAGARLTTQVWLAVSSVTMLAVLRKIFGEDKAMNNVEGNLERLEEEEEGEEEAE